MAQFDPALRKETRLLKDIGGGNSVELKYALVEYDGTGEQYIEPISTDIDGQYMKPENMPKIAGFLPVKSRPFVPFAFDEYDANSVGV